jgi:hypothetical protein
MIYSSTNILLQSELDANVRLRRASDSKRQVLWTNPAIEAVIQIDGCEKEKLAKARSEVLELRSRGLHLLLSHL